MKIFTNISLFSTKINRKMVKWGLCVLLMISFFLGGCWPGADRIGEYEYDVSEKGELWSGYAKGQCFVLRHDIFLEKIDISQNRMYAAVPPTELTCGNYMLLYSAPVSIEVYHKEPDKWPEIVGILKAGTRIQCDKLLKSGTLMWPGSYVLLATIKNGPFTGKSVDISDISFAKRINNQWLNAPNFNMIQNIECKPEI